MERESAACSIRPLEGVAEVSRGRVRRCLRRRIVKMASWAQGPNVVVVVCSGRTIARRMSMLIKDRSCQKSLLGCRRLQY